MRTVLVVGHMDFASGMVSAVKLVAGGISVMAENFSGDVDLETYREQLQKRIDSLENVTEILIFADILGGTPFNAAMMCAQNDPRIHVVSGANLPLIVQVSIMLDEAEDVSSLIDESLSLMPDAMRHFH